MTSCAPSSSSICPRQGSYATGIAFLPQSSKDAAAACEAVEKIAEAEGLQVLGWREVPTDDSSLGALARDAMPTFRQVFIAGASGMDLERRAYVVRKRAEHELGTKGPGQDGPGRETVYFPSLSGQTFVYKGMLTTPQLKAFYLDLQDDRLDQRAGHRALAVLHEHVPVVAAGPPVPADRAQRRDQHRHRQRELDAGARGADQHRRVRFRRRTSTRSSRSARPAPPTPRGSTRCSSCCTSAAAACRTPC